MRTIIKTCPGLHAFLTALLLILIGRASAQEYRTVGEMPVPVGCARVTVAEASFGAWLRTLPLKREAVIRAWDGREVRNPIYSVMGVVGLPILFRRDLEQCADYAMRLWAEYHRSRGRLDELRLFEYSGKRVRFPGSGQTYEAFLRRCFSNANSHSLKKGCAVVRETELTVGDLIVQNERGGIGHVSVILDACTTKSGGPLYLIGFSFMPAQEFHIERADDAHGRGGWFTLEDYTRWLGDNLDVGTPVLRRFIP